MSEEKKKTLAELQQEYQQQAVRAGHLAYQVSALKKELAVIFDLQRDLNFEAAKLEAESKSAEAPKSE